MNESGKVLTPYSPIPSREEGKIGVSLGSRSRRGRRATPAPTALSPYRPSTSAEGVRSDRGVDRFVRRLPTLFP